MTGVPLQYIGTVTVSHLKVLKFRWFTGQNTAK